MLTLIFSIRLIGSHVTDQLLARGYKVRGAVRDVEKSSWLTAFFADKYPSAEFSLVSVPDMTVEGCYDEVVKGMFYSLFLFWLSSSHTYD